MLRDELLTEAQRLIAGREPFVVVTVVKARRPTSGRPGDSAVVLADGTIRGFVGGVCATTSVRLHALRALETGEPVSLRLLPGDDEDAFGAASAGAVVERNPCLSGGAMELFLEPHLPAEQMIVLGDSPIARAVERIGQAAGYAVARHDPGGVEGTESAAVVVVASHGNDEERVLAAALEAGVPYVALVASETRGAAVRAALPVPDELRVRLHTPAGLAIDARTPEETAISILAEIVSERRAGLASAPPPVLSAAPAEATDPVCGMRVLATEATPRLRVGEETLFFCCEGCRDRYAREHAGADAPR